MVAMSQNPIVPTARPKQKRPQAVLNVQAREQLTPRLLRLTLGGPGYHHLARNHHTDAYVKLLLPPVGSDLTPPYDLDTLRAEHPELMPALRTYTVRTWDDAAEQIILDVVLHDEPGHSGIASAWAANAQIGDSIAMRGAGGGYSPDPDSRTHLLIGDHATVPAIAAALEALAATARGTVLIHVDDDADILPLTHPDGMHVRWVVGEREQLLDAVRALDLPDLEGLQVFCHAERGLTKQLRRHLVRERGIARDAISVSAYWALGRIEDQFQAEKREPIGRIDEDD